MKDKRGNSVCAGDILLEETGFYTGSKTEKRHRTLRLWEMPDEYDYCHGIYYLMSGRKAQYAWAKVGESVKLSKKKLPDEFLFSFYHGMEDIYSYKDWGEEKFTISDEEDVYEIVMLSDWKDRKITQKDVDEYSFIQNLEINTIDDVKRNIQILSTSNHISYGVMHQVIEAMGYKRTDVCNGEIGLAFMEDHALFDKIISDLIEKGKS